MVLAKFDWLTPPVTLYYKGELQHTSIGSATISMIGYCSAIVIGIYLSFDFFMKSNPTVFCFNRYIEDAGNFTFNSRGVFSHFQLISTEPAFPRELDFSYIRVIGTELSIQRYLEKKNTSDNDHWIYGLCDNETDIEGIKHLYNYDTFNQSYCIKKFYKKDDKKYYPIGDKNFRWPYADKGTSNSNKTFYGLVFEDCKEDELWYEISGGKKCKNESEIHKYINNHYVRFFMIDYYPDVYNYKNPFKKYFYNIDTTLSSGSYTFNHINFNRAKIISHNGIFLDKSIEENGYIIDQNAQETGEYRGAYLAFYFWLKNKIIIYERTYKTFQDVFAEIEGMSDLIIFAATIINNFISEYVTLKDTAHVLFILRSKNINKTEIKRILQSNRRTMFLKNYPPRKNNVAFNYYFNLNKNNNENSEKLKINNSHKRVVSFKSNKKREILYQRVMTNKTNKTNKTNNNKNKYIENSANFGTSIMKRNLSTVKDRSCTPIDADVYSNLDKIESLKKNDKEKNDAEENIMPSFDPFKEASLNFFEFAYNYVLFCKKKKNLIEAYDNFRIKIISEENMIQNYLDIYTINKTIQQITKDDGVENQ